MSDEVSDNNEGTGTNSVPGGPTRRSLRDRMADASSRSRSSLTEDYVGDSTSLTSTSLNAITSLSEFSQTFSVGVEGVSQTSQVAPISATISTSAPARSIDEAAASEHHLLLLADEVDPLEIEALALSIWDEARWEGAGQLHLVGEARLVGPWSIDATLRKTLKTPASLTNVWVLECPKSRRNPVDPQLAVLDEWASVFPDGVPVGLEYRILTALKRMARRLGGAVRVADSGKMIAPDPDSAVSLTVYTPRWLDPEDLLNLLKPHFPQLTDSRQIATPAPQSAQQVVQKNAAIAAEPGTIRTDIATKIAKARELAEKAAKEVGATPEVVAGYALVTPIANRSDLMIEVEPIPRPPQVLRWESWTTGVIIEYHLKWLPAGMLEPPTGVSRTARLERMRSSRDIEKVAEIIVTAVGGSVIDEDGFLVGLVDDTAIE